MLIHKKKKTFLQRKALLIFPLFLCIFTFSSFEAQGCFEECFDGLKEVSRNFKQYFEDKEPSPEMRGLLADIEGVATDEEILRPLLKQLRKDTFPEKVSWSEWLKENSLALGSGSVSSYILSILLANDGAVDDLFGIATDDQAMTLGITILTLHLLPEIIHAKKNIRGLKHW